jgi:energy-coupling factor transport system substrate-specific component
VSAAAGWLHDVPIYYAELTPGDWITLLVIYVISGAVIAGVGSWWLMRLLAQSGVLAQFPSGRAQSRV